MASLEQLAEKYCLCINSDGAGFPVTQPSYERSFQKLSKNDVNLELLKEFEFETTEVQDPKDGTISTIYKCRFGRCDKQFNRTWNMLDHARTHKGVRPFKCQWWSKRFTQKGNMRKHLKQHVAPTLNERKKFKCEICSSRYTEKYNYNVSYVLLHVFCNGYYLA